MGQVCAIGLGLQGLFLGDVLLVLIGCFVFFAARAEKNFVAARPLDDLDPAHPYNPDTNTTRKKNDVTAKQQKTGGKLVC